ncbi:MAG: abortive phage resistance protein, partial [Dehalococcoidia bacterium]|nr:abortive phage resistance protein [Dehalococcoidia bacterium]
MSNGTPSVIEEVEELQNILSAYACGAQLDSPRYSELRKKLLATTPVAEKLPSFVRTCSTLPQFWHFIQPKIPTYKGRREFIQSEFTPALEFLRKDAKTPADQIITDVLDEASVSMDWERALDRRTSDPEAAITSARSLLETVCKRILDDKGRKYEHSADLPELYREVARTLSISPGKELDKVFNQIFSGCIAIV